ncbi:hypothetical protein PVK06_033400 [Gossypium arboreum]|uniref:Uncharacterized protein n=1 Tax=Gossypium arboreum TaxID=29729 RepID=A0ABR0NDH7_GOSAR|nr:hypothetical protein PVK06_033400 [Gossypium arboreum]
MVALAIEARLKELCATQISRCMLAMTHQEDYSVVIQYYTSSLIRKGRLRSIPAVYFLTEIIHQAAVSFQVLEFYQIAEISDSHGNNWEFLHKSDVERLPIEAVRTPPYVLDPIAELRVTKICSWSKKRELCSDRNIEVKNCYIGGCASREALDYYQRSLEESWRTSCGRSKALSIVACFNLRPGVRRLKGTDYRVRRKFKGSTLVPNTGYGSNRKTRQYLSNGLKKFTVLNVGELRSVE